ncbi:MAG: peptidoglycan-binding protein [Deltaproteobacteria bacterium]|nr:peptidoglycan-binding protein [Deltaproteobacteria bacterium]
MAIRGPQGAPLPPDAATSRAPSSSPQQRLVDFGMARTPAEARAVLQQIVALLAGAGFPVPKTGSPDQQLPSALREFQQSAGLPATGQLDAATVRALQQQGLAPARPDDGARAGSTTTAPPAPDAVRFVPAGPSRVADALPRLRAGAGADAAPGARARDVETDAARARVDAGRPDVRLDLQGLLGALRTAGFAGVGRGREQLADAVKKLQRADGLPVTGRLDAATAQALERRGVLNAATAQALKEQDPAWRAAAATAAATTAATTANAEPRTPVDGAPAEPVAPGTVAPRSEDAEGRGGPPPTMTSGAGRGDEGGDSTTRGATEHNGVVDDGEEGGDGDGVGRDAAGDDDAERKQGNANVDGDDDEAGSHWRAPSLSAQIERALAGVRRDDDRRGAATYRLELLLVRPGVYTAGQPAPELLRLVVERAGPFDDAWGRALAALNDRLRRHDPDARPLTDDDVRVALRRARYRDDAG